MFTRRLFTSRIWLAASAIAMAMIALPALADPPGRVARLSYIQGDVNFQPSGVDQWTEASLNRPLIPGDNLYADRAARVELEIGTASIRLDERSAFGLLRLDDDNAQIELTEGVLNLRVKRIFDGQTYEIDTPTLALVVDRAGSYRVDIAPDGSSTMISVVEGSANVYGENNASYSVRSGQSYRFYDTSLNDYEVLDLPRQDDFDRWVSTRDDRYTRSVSRQYVSDEVIGYADLDDYGSWSTAPTYGSIWYPSRVDAGWAPYRSGRWSWVDPWGWTWVDNHAWGFAPFHYGRWAYVGSRWGWVPGPRAVRPIYAPALVAFVGGGGVSVSISSGGPVGWFPLGPRDVYVPWYRGSRNYFNNVNVRNTTIINNTYITNVYNDYSRGRPVTNFNYAYRNNERAFTAVPRDAFINSRAVDRSRVQVAQAQLARGNVLSRVDVAPNQTSMFGGATVRGARPQAGAAFDRRVIAHSAPPQRANMQSRLQAIERNGNQPLAIDQLRDLGRTAKPGIGNDRASRVQVVGSPQRNAQVQPLPARAPMDRSAARNDGDARTPGAGRTTPEQRTPAGSRAAPAVTDRGVERNVQPGGNVRTPATGARPVERNSGNQDRALPSSRFTEGRREAEGARPVTQREAGQQRQPAASREPSRAVGDRNPADGNGSVRTISAPQREIQPRSAPQQREVQQRSAPQQREVQPRSAPQQREIQQRSAPQQREVQQRSAPQQREVQQRSAPQQREVQQRSAPQQREIQQRSAPQQREVQQRSAPQQREVQQRSAPQQQRAQQPQKQESENNNGGREPKRRDDR